MGEADRLFEFLDRDESGSLSIVESLRKKLGKKTTNLCWMKRPFQPRLQVVPFFLTL